MSINYKKRRQKALTEIGEGSLMAVFSNPESYRNADNIYPYRQESLFYYLTGFEEPDSVLILSNKKENDKELLFLRKKDKNAELWTGTRLGIEQAPEKLNIDKAYPIDELWQKLPELMMGAEKVFYKFDRNIDQNQKFILSLRAHRQKRGRTICSMLPVYDTDIISGRLRLKKDKDEIKIIKDAASITKKMFASLFKYVRPGLNERQVYGHIVGEYLKHGSEREAFPAIIAGGENACCLHYVKNNSDLKDGDLILVDTGCELNYYASDVTRTFPIGKTFNNEQRALYELVLSAAYKGTEAAAPGSSIQKIHQIVVDHLTEGLIELKLLKGNKKEIIEKALYKKYYPHNTSHWIGLDVHDIGDYEVSGGAPLILEEGMYFSIEPGLYIPTSDNDAPEKFRGIGIRIEDDILITANGNEVITKDIPKNISDLENR